MIKPSTSRPTRTTSRVSRRAVFQSPTAVAAVLASLAACLWCEVPTAAAAPATAPVDFVRDVRPILQTRCYSCHGPEKQKGGLRLDVKAAALKGGEHHGPAVRPHAASDSPLIRFVSAPVDAETRMPPKGEPLTAEQVAILRTWIDQGATWPADADTAAVRDPADHWAFKPVARPEPPLVTDAAWPRNAVDRFVLARLERERLRPLPEADRLSWLRRVHFDLIGLPPTPEEVDAFAADASPDAFGKVVDRLLDSPHYGERWARHWLDVIAFGETDGFEVNTPRPNAWPYRDYVIRALNEDRPYPRFVRDQLAGDATGEDAATGFLVAAAALLPGQTGKDEPSIRLARQDELNGMVLTTSAAFLGLTVSCARCHDHKFDPIPQADYHAMQAVFAGVRHGERPMRTDPSPAREATAASARERLVRVEAHLAALEPLADPKQTSGGDSTAARPTTTARPAVDPLRNADRFAPVAAKRLRFTIEQTNRLEPCIDELEVFAAGPDARNVAAAAAGAKVTASGTFPNAAIHRLEHINDGRYGNGRSWISNEAGRGWVEIEFAREETIDRVAWARDREGRYADRLPTAYKIEVATAAGGPWTLIASSADRRPYAEKQKVPPPSPAGGAVTLSPPPDVQRLLAERAALIRQLAELSAEQRVYAGVFVAPEPIHRLNRGDPMQPREPIGPGVLARVGPKLDLPPDAAEQRRRLALADWIASPHNPLTARVMVNRVWQHHFGEGIVDTPSDFGNNGGRPAHPELLDWLADEFVRRGWSLKAMHRVICLSATYRQSSRPNDAGLAADAAGRLLWRYPPRRMEAELIRDAVLATCGTLDRRMGGPGYSAFEPNDNYVRVYDPKRQYGPPEWRRMVYQTKVRIAQDSTFGAFDCPDAGLPQPRRPRSTTPLQALSLFNSTFVTQQADRFAERLGRDAGDDPAKQVRRAFVLALGREPDAEEARSCERLVREHGLPNFCRVVLNLNEFLFVR